MIVDGIDVDYYENHDFGPEMKKAREEGRAFTLSGCTIENVIDKLREKTAELNAKRSAASLSCYERNSSKYDAKEAGKP